jgi:acetyl-CoA carboxylase carboxyl transferase subunit beta
LSDDGFFEELYPDLDLADLDHGGYDNEAYRIAREEARALHRVGEAVRVGIGKIEGRACALAVSDFRFFGGTLGAACGEKIRLLCEVARAEQLPLITLTCSGGARMQDGTLGLVQMAKTNAAIIGLLQQGIPYISILTDPCTGGALGSYATLGTVVLAEPRALIAFAGPRVMKLAGLSVDENLLDSEHAAEHGGVDEVVARGRLKARIRRYLDICNHGENGLDEPSRAVLPSSRLSGRYTSHWFTDFTTRLSTLLDEAHDLFGLRPGAHVAWASVPRQLAELALVTIPTILEQATRSEDPEVRERAAQALARFPRPDRARLEQALRAEHPRIQANAAYELLAADRGHPEALAVLRGLLAAEDASSRRAGLFVISRIPIETLRAEVDRLCGVPEMGVRVPAIMTLFAYGDVERGSGLLRSLVASVGPYGARLAKRLLPLVPPEHAQSVQECLRQIVGEER